MMRDLKVCVVMPTYNNAGTIRDVVQRIMAFSDDIIVVNDGCTDDTSQILNELSGKIKVEEILVLARISPSMAVGL